MSKPKSRPIWGSLFGDNGGFVVLETSGQGQLCISGCGTLMEVEVNSQNGETVIDNGHVVAWDSSLSYNIGMPSSRNRGMLGNLLNSVTSGEGMVLKFQGYVEVVIICSRNRNSYITWLASVLNLGQR